MSGRSEEREAVAGRWQGPAQGSAYARARFASAARRERDPRLVASLLQRAAGEGEPLASLLDAPCGTGRLQAALASLAPLVVGLDVSRAMLREVEPRRSPARLVEGSVFELPFADASFDCAVACRLLHHFSDPGERRRVLAELARVARRYVVVSYWDARSWTAWRRRAPRPFRRRRTDARVAVDARALDADLASAGLVPLRRAHSLRFVSAQTFVLASVLGRNAELGVPAAKPPRT